MLARLPFLLTIFSTKKETQERKNDIISRLWWDVLDSDQLAPYWPTNPGDGHTIGCHRIDTWF